MLKTNNIWGFLFFLLLHVDTYGSFPGIQNKGEGVFGLKFNMVATKKYYDMDGEAQDFYKYRHFITLFQANYGISNKFNLILYAPVLIHNTVELTFPNAPTSKKSFSGIGDPSLGLKYLLLKQERLKTFIALSGTLPIGEDEEANLLNTGYGTFTESASLNAEYSVNSKLLVYGEVGFTNKENGFTDDVFSTAEIKYKTVDNLWLIIKAWGLFPLENGSENVHGGLPGLYSNNTGCLSLEPELMFELNDIFNITASGAILVKGQIIQAAPRFSVAINYKLIHALEK